MSSDTRNLIPAVCGSESTDQHRRCTLVLSEANFKQPGTAETKDKITLLHQWQAVMQETVSNVKYLKKTAVKYQRVPNTLAQFKTRRLTNTAQCKIQEH